MSGIEFVRFLYEDEDLIVTAKPAKIAVHPSDLCRDRRTLLHMVRNKSGGEHVFPVHRLDKPVSGPVLFAKSPEMATSLQEQFVNQEVDKIYLALVRGWVNGEGAIDHPLVKHQSGAMLECRTEYRCLGQARIDEAFGKYDSVRYSLLKLKPITGRFHQLRRHLRDIAHPIIGDTTDGDSHQNRFFRERYSLRRLMLHCFKLSFRQPSSGEKLVFVQELDREFREVMEQLDFSETIQQLN